MKNVKCARCVRCGKEYEAIPNLTNCSCGGILDIVYDYDYIKAHFTKETLKNRVNPTMWRYRELLPVEDTTPDTPLRVGWSPLYEEPKLAEMLGLGRLWVKDDGINPTASLKDRASAMAVAKAHEAGAKIIACSSTGNAASSLAGNAAAAGFKTYIFVPERAPKGKVAQLMIFGANVISVKGNYEETFKMSAEAIEKWGWYNRNAAINPYLSEGKKTVSLEIAEQLNWEMPDYLAISVGDGCTIAGVWKGLKDLYAIGFIDKLPRLISAQSTGCYPITRAIQENKPWEPMEENTIADSISVGVPRNADKALMAIRESNGIAINVTDEEILAAQKLLGRTCGVFGEPAGVTGTAAVKGHIPQRHLGAILKIEEAGAGAIVAGDRKCARLRPDGMAAAVQSQVLGQRQRSLAVDQAGGVQLHVPEQPDGGALFRLGHCLRQGGILSAVDIRGVFRLDAVLPGPLRHGLDLPGGRRTKHPLRRLGIGRQHGGQQAQSQQSGNKFSLHVCRFLPIGL